MAVSDQQISGVKGILACHECDLLHRIENVPVGGKALCSRCGTVLFRHRPDHLNHALALNLAALICFMVANAFPFLSMEIAGRVEEMIFISGTIALYQQGMGELALLVFLTSLLFPLISIVGMLYILLPIKFGIRLPGMSGVCRMVLAVRPWSMLDVLLLSVLIAIAKLLDIANIIPGISFYAFVALVLLTAAATANFDVGVLWPLTDTAVLSAEAGRTATERDLINCHTCGMLIPASTVHENGRCPRCHGRLHRRKENSVSRTWALIISSMLLLIPANIYPVMTVIRFGQGEPNTILSGVVHLVESGMWPLAMIVFIASIIIPVTKLLILSFLQLSVQKGSSWRLRDRTVLYRFTELVGSWSMVDIFLIALLTALVKLDALSTITPGVGAIFFAGVVVTTIFAARSFDPRLIWDHGGERD